MFTFIDKAVIGIALLRLISGSIEILASYLMIRFNDIEKSMIINTSLALVGPVILILTTAIGLAGMLDKVSYSKFIWIFLGVGFIIYGVKSN